jgi:hypothetical protein
MGLVAARIATMGQYEQARLGTGRDVAAMSLIPGTVSSPVFWW